MVVGLSATTAAELCATDEHYAEGLGAAVADCSVLVLPMLLVQLLDMFCSGAAVAASWSVDNGTEVLCKNSVIPQTYSLGNDPGGFMEYRNGKALFLRWTLERKKPNSFLSRVLPNEWCKGCHSCQSLQAGIGFGQRLFRVEGVVHLQGAAQPPPSECLHL